MFHHGHPRGRKMQHDFRAASQFARDADPPTHILHHSLHEIKAEAHAANLIVAHGLYSVKRLEDVREVGGRNADAFVLHADPDFRFWVGRRGMRADSDPVTIDITDALKDKNFTLFHPFTTTLVEVVLNRVPYPFDKVEGIFEWLPRFPVRAGTTD